MSKIFKSDLTYSLTGGFLLGMAALFFMAPADLQPGAAQDFTQITSAAGELLG